MSRWFFEGAKGKIVEGTIDSQNCDPEYSAASLCKKGDLVEIRVELSSTPAEIAKDVLKNLVAFQNIWTPLANQEAGNTSAESSRLQALVAQAWVKDSVERAQQYQNTVDASEVSRLAADEGFSSKLMILMAYRFLASPNSNSMVRKCFPRSAETFLNGATPDKAKFDRVECEKSLAPMRR